MKVSSPVPWSLREMSEESDMVQDVSAVLASPLVAISHPGLPSRMYNQKWLQWINQILFKLFVSIEQDSSFQNGGTWAPESRYGRLWLFK